MKINQEEPKYYRFASVYCRNTSHDFPSWIPPRGGAIRKERGGVFGILGDTPWERAMSLAPTWSFPSYESKGAVRSFH